MLFRSRLGLVPDHWPVATGVFYFYLGGVVEAALREMPANVVRRFAPLAIVAALIFAWATFGSDIRFMAYVDPTGEAKVPKWATPIFGCLLVFGFEGLARHAGVARLFARVMPLADTTYSSYLVHFPIQLAVVTVVDRLGVARTIFDAPAVLVAFLAVVFGSAWVVFHRFERPMQNRLRALSGGATARMVPKDGVSAPR